MANYSDSIDISLQRNNDIDNLNDGVKQFMLVKYVESDIESYSYGDYGGWKAELLFNKLTPIEEKLLICSTCHGVMRDAVFYGKVSACEVCVSAERSKYVLHNNNVRDIINELQIKCPLTGDGCDWTGAIETLTAHFPSCLYYPVPCPLECTVIDNNSAEPVITTLPRNKVESHVTETCPNREIKCNYCDTPIKAVEMDIHVSECEAFPLACPNNCINPHNNEPTLVKRGEMNNHIEIECAHVELDCPFKPNGCAVGKILRKDLATHEQDSMTQHLRLMNLNFKQKLEEKDNQISTLQKQLTDAYIIINKFAIVINCVYSSNSFDWTIRNVGDHILNKATIRSDYFYVRQYKYYCSVKFRSRNNNYLSIYAHICKGEFDDHIRWPFSGSYTFTLINRDDFSANYIRILKVNSLHSDFQQPIQGNNDGHGFLEFINLSELQSYLRNDSLILNFSICLD